MTAASNPDIPTPDTISMESLLNTPDLSTALENDRFRQFLDHVPVAIAVSEIPGDTIAYANFEFERIAGEAAAAIEGKAWHELRIATAASDKGRLGDAILSDEEYIGLFALDRDGAATAIEAWSNVITNDDGAPQFRLVALADSSERTDQHELARRVAETDVLLQELQHRVRNNLQMITALIRLESRGIPHDASKQRFDRLAGRVESLGLLYHSLSDGNGGSTVDLGTYLSQIASSVMQAHAVDGVRLELKVDSWPVSIDVAMPTGLVVNELMTNALKYAFADRDGGTIKVSSLTDDSGCRVIVADDGNGLPAGDVWPRKGKLGNLIVNSLKQNAKAQVSVESAPGQGMRVTIFFAKADAAP
jgi:two-component sensor histidine kinase